MLDVHRTKPAATAPRLQHHTARTSLAHYRARLLASALLIGLASCGGGGGGGGGSGGGGSAPATHNVTAIAQNGGSITPASAVVTAGGQASFVVAPASGYTVEAVTGCGGTLSGTSYTTASVTSACSVTATFRALQFHVDVLGYADDGLVIANNAAERVAVPGDGRYNFATGILVGAPYSVSVAEQPRTQACFVEDGEGVVSATAARVVTVTCVNRAVQTGPTMVLRTKVGTAGAVEQMLYVRTPAAMVRQFRIRPVDGVLEELLPIWQVTGTNSFLTTLQFSPEGDRAYADDAFSGAVVTATVRELDGALVPSWTDTLAQYLPAPPVTLTSLRVSPSGRTLYRNVSFVLSGEATRDLWVATVSDSGFESLNGGLPFDLAADAGFAFEARGRYFARGVRATNQIEVYRAFGGNVQSPALLASYPSAFPGHAARSLSAEARPGRLLYESEPVTEIGPGQGTRPRLALHRWEDDGSLHSLGAPILGAPLTGEIAGDVCSSGSDSTRRTTQLSRLTAPRAPIRYFVQRQDAQCQASPFTMDFRLLAIHILRVSGTTAELVRLPVETLPGASDVGTIGAPHPTEPWLYMVSEDGNQIFGYAIDAAGGTVQAIAGSPVTAPPAQTPADPALTYLMVDQTGRYLYVTRFPTAAPGPEHVLVFGIDQVTGALSAISNHLL